MDQKTFRTNLIQIALPITLQSLLSCSFSMVDQMMIGQLGLESIAGVGIASRFGSIFNFSQAALTAVAGILIAQYIGQSNKKDLQKSFWVSALLICLLAAFFMVFSLSFPEQILSLYSPDPMTVGVGASYLRIYMLTALPLAVSSITSVILRCYNKAKYAFWASVAGALVNTILNVIFIFGFLGFPAMGVQGVALASVIGMLVSMAITLHFCIGTCREHGLPLRPDFGFSPQQWKQYFTILIPIFISEVGWVLGENVYSLVYGHLGTEGLAAMTIILVIVQLVCGALSGLAQAAAILCGRALGEGNRKEAYDTGKKLLHLGLGSSLILALCTAAGAGLYTNLYQVEPDVRKTAVELLWVFALYAPVKVENMIVGNGILRSGGKTTIIMVINLIGTWCIGVPLAVLSSSVWHFGIVEVYATLSLEEVFRLAVCLVLFRRKKWMQTL